MTPRLPDGCVIAVLGAESTGKSELTRAIAARLRQRGVATTLVGEVLREWCDREGRTPRKGEQAAIAAEQTRRIAAAATQGVVVADTTALMTAVYSELQLSDDSLYADALAAQRGCAITLLTALDLPWVADGLQRDGPHRRELVDARVRAVLARAGLPFAVVHGSGADRLSGAWSAINSIADSAETARATGQSGSQNGGVWRCDRCFDPACEHRLFSELVAQK